MATHSRILAWKIPWTEEPGGLQSTELHRVRHDWSDSACMHTVAAAAKSLQSCPTLCDPLDGSPTGSPVPGILQARTLEWVAISFSNACKWKVKLKSLSRVWLFATPWTAAYQAPPSMGFIQIQPQRNRNGSPMSGGLDNREQGESFPSFALLLLTFVVIRVWEKKQPPSGEESRSLRRQPQIS